MIRRVCIVFTMLFVFAPAAFPQTATPSADDIARRTLQILSAPGAWEKVRYVAFTFNVERNGKIVASYPQKFNLATGEYNVSGKTADGLLFDVTMNVFTKKGHGTIDGQPVTDNTQFQTLYSFGFRQFMADTNWLLLPFKLFETGVHRTYDGQRTDSCGHTWDLLKLTFDQQPGLPAGDEYWLWVNRDTGVIEEWDIRQAGAPKEQLPIEVMLRSYQRVGGLLISTRREIPTKGQTLRFDDLQILPEAPKDAFK